ncbi:MAG: hypothetical protein CL398_04765 [Acidiferrobacteraceae bacterium]|nr:hypothetical protein [Acidiferrobacteraceae bacterium]
MKSGKFFEGLGDGLSVPPWVTRKYDMEFVEDRRCTLLLATMSLLNCNMLLPAQAVTSNPGY